MFDDKVCRAPLWTEFFFAYAGGTGVGVPTLADIARTTRCPTGIGQGHAALSELRRVFLFLPTHPHDILDLGGEHRAYLGDEAYSFTEPNSRLRAGQSAPQSPVLQARGPALLHARHSLDDNGKFHDGEFTPLPAQRRSSSRRGPRVSFPGIFQGRGALWI